MTTVVVGVANLQTSLPVDGFPVPYSPVRYLPGQVVTSVGGVGFNVARTLSGLGEAVRLMAPLGRDVPAAAILAEAERLGIDTAGCTYDLPQTPRSVILHAPTGARQVNTDLAGALGARFAPEPFIAALTGADAAVLGNLNLSRPLLALARERGVPVVVDLQDVPRTTRTTGTSFSPPTSWWPATSGWPQTIASSCDGCEPRPGRG